MKADAKSFLKSQDLRETTFHLPKLNYHLSGLSRIKEIGISMSTFTAGWITLIVFCPLSTVFLIMTASLSICLGMGRVIFLHLQLNHFQDYLFYLFDLITAQGYEQINLVGHSMGAGISTLFAGAFPQMVSKLVLIEGIGPLSANVDEAPSRMAQAIQSWHRQNSQAPSTLFQSGPRS